MLNRDNKLWAPWRMEHIKRDLSNDKNKCIFCVDVNNSDDRKNLILFRGKFSFIIMNLYPYNNGHLMVCPYRHVASLSKLNEETLSEIKKFGVKVKAYKLDISKFNETQDVLQKIYNDFGNINILINNAGFTKIKKFVETNIDD